MDNSEKHVEKQRGGITGKGFMPGQSGNPGGRPPKDESYAYWLRFFKNLTKEEFQKYRIEYIDTMPMAALGAWQRVFETIKNSRTFDSIANRTEGMPKQSIDQTITEIPPIEFVRKNED